MYDDDVRPGRNDECWCGSGKNTRSAISDSTSGWKMLAGKGMKSLRARC